MFAVTIWRLTIMGMVAAMVALVYNDLLGPPPMSVTFDAHVGWIALGLIVVLRIWSVGLLYRREYDLYVISLTCWLGLIGIRGLELTDTTTSLEIAISLWLGLLLDAVQVRALAKAVARALEKKEPVNA